MKTTFAIFLQKLQRLKKTNILFGMSDSEISNSEKPKNTYSMDRYWPVEIPHCYIFWLHMRVVYMFLRSLTLKASSLWNSCNVRQQINDVVLKTLLSLPGPFILL